MDRQLWVNWEAAGAPTMYDRVKARLREILTTHKPPPLPDGVAEKIEAILQAAEARGKQR
jgi:trimethylamine:corrinoid methyltransferase-like protein